MLTPAFFSSAKTEMRLKHAKQELQPKQSQLKKTESEYKRDEDVLKKTKKAFDAVQAKLNALNYTGYIIVRLCVRGYSVELPVNSKVSCRVVCDGCKTLSQGWSFEAGQLLCMTKLMKAIFAGD